MEPPTPRRLSQPQPWPSAGSLPAENGTNPLALGAGTTRGCQGRGITLQRPRNSRLVGVEEFGEKHLQQRPSPVRIAQLGGAEEENGIAGKFQVPSRRAR